MSGTQSPRSARDERGLGPAKVVPSIADTINLACWYLHFRSLIIAIPGAARGVPCKGVLERVRTFRPIGEKIVFRAPCDDHHLKDRTEVVEE